MYAIRHFFYLSKTPLKKFTGKVRYESLEEANEVAIRMTLMDKETDIPPFKSFHFPVKIIDKDEYYTAKWDEFAKTWNNTDIPEYYFPLEPTKEFINWISYYKLLTAEQFMELL